MKYIKLYESFEDFEETWIQEEDNDDNIKKHKLPLLLYNFLKKEKVLDKFINNFEKKYPNKIFYNALYNSHLEDLIDFAFFWGGTPEGCYFWAEIDKKWQKIVNKDNNKSNLKSYELYENFEDDFEEIWIDEPEHFENYFDFKLVMYIADRSRDIYLIQKFINDKELILYKDFIYYSMSKFDVLFKIIDKKKFNAFINDYVDIKIFYDTGSEYQKKYSPTKKAYFSDLPDDIRKKIIDSHHEIY